MGNIERRSLIPFVVLIAAIITLSVAVFGGRADASAVTRANAEAAEQAHSIYTVYVPDDLLTIQAALDAAAAVYAPLAAVGAAADVYTWTTIIVRDGVYTGPRNKNLDFKGYPTYLRSENGPDNCVIDMQGDGRGFDFHSGETSHSVLDGFTITNGFVAGGEWLIGYGGGIQCVSGSSPTITNCVISDNRARGGGGIFCLANSSPAIINCAIERNSVDFGGGGIYSRASAPKIIGCSISGNSAGHGGGIAYKDYSTVDIVNSSIDGNLAKGIGGGISGDDSSGTITNCTIYGNSAAREAHVYGAGGGIDLNRSESLSLVNCILWGNTADHGGEISMIRSFVYINFTDIEGGQDDIRNYETPLIWGPGNIDADPLFVAPGYWDGDIWVDGDYHLTAASPCIDSGTDAGVYTDIDGDDRPNGVGFDMGSDEFYHYDVPRIGLHPAILENSSLRGENAPLQGITVWNSGGGTLSYSVTDNAGWLSVSPGGGTSTGEADSITVRYYTSGLDSGVYSATITFSDPSASNNPQYVPVVLTVNASDLTSINCESPPNGALLFSGPTFSWTVDGGTDNIYAVDFAMSPGWRILSTWENLHLRITDTSWTMPGSVWNRIPHGSYVYWRVRGADLSLSPPIVTYSDEVWWFYKP